MPPKVPSARVGPSVKYRALWAAARSDAVAAGLSPPDAMRYADLEARNPQRAPVPESARTVAVAPDVADVPATGSGYVYVLTSDLLPVGTFKIGLTVDLPGRMRAFKTGLPGARFVHTAAVRDPRRIESILHKLFADCRFDGEWFHDMDLPRIEGAIAAAKLIIEG